MCHRLRYWKIQKEGRSTLTRSTDDSATECVNTFPGLTPSFIAGVSAVPYLLRPQTAQLMLKVESFYKGSWQWYGNYDLVRGYIYPFMGSPNSAALRGAMLTYKPLHSLCIPEETECRVTFQGKNLLFGKIDPEFIRGLEYYQKHIDSNIAIVLESEH